MTTENKNFDEIVLFKTSVFARPSKEYLDLVIKVSSKPEYHSEVYDGSKDPVEHKTEMSGNFFHDEELSPFSQFVVQSAWDILQYQGYAMKYYNTFFESMWLQNHGHDSFMAQHVHSNPVQIVGFYFTEIDSNSSKLLLHDPRPAKVQTDLQEEDNTKATSASRTIVLTPNVGDLILAPAWLSHSFSYNQSDKQMKFVHINIGVKVADQQPQCKAPEII